MTKSVVKSIKLTPDMVITLKEKSKILGISQCELIRVAIKSIADETLEKIREVRQLINA
ncbi:MAG: hypothetical protein HEQ24_02275 [Dolichospermum sp. BR01]|jgi:hypothetical protein|nr:hypothetical protein [Dolichospermum sp. BR01]